MEDNTKKEEDPSMEESKLMEQDQHQQALELMT